MKEIPSLYYSVTVVCSYRMLHDVLAIVPSSVQITVDVATLFYNFMAAELVLPLYGGRLLCFWRKCSFLLLRTLWHYEISRFSELFTFTE